MKLLDLLVKELPVFGGWPDGYHYAAQDRDSELFFYEHKPEYINGGGSWILSAGEVSGFPFPQKKLATDHATAIITREKYEEALAAKTELPVWDGEGLPPVGTVCEFYSATGRWSKVEITAIGRHGVLFCEFGKDGENYTSKNRDFRPIRTPEQIEAERRERVIKQMLDAWNLGGDGTFQSVCNAIYDAIRDGKIEGVKIDE